MREKRSAVAAAAIIIFILTAGCGSSQAGTPARNSELEMAGTVRDTSTPTMTEVPTPRHVQSPLPANSWTPTIPNASTPTATERSRWDAISIAAGGNHSCAMVGIIEPFDGFTIQCWGKNDFGQLGDGTTTDSNRVVHLTNWSEVDGIFKAIVAGWGHTCAMGNFVDEEPGGVACWGYNKNGELGDGTNLNNNGYPRGISRVQDLHDAVALAAGDDHTCAVLNGGGVKCWGFNGDGQLGDGTTNDSNTPEDAEYLSSGVIAITAGWGHTCALIQDAGIRCWGDNEYGQLGDGTDVPYRAVRGMVSGLEKDIVGISAGGGHTCALKQDGRIMCWGQNNYGQLGDGTTKNSNLPVYVKGLSLLSGETISSLAAGRNHTCALTDRRRVMCWGWNSSGQLGDGTMISRTIPVVADTHGNDILGLSAGGEHTCVITTEYNALCWGDNDYGQLGNGTNASSGTPVEVIGLGIVPED
jgi:alpha-tubulin suppressor-like RCC1 family protein